MFKPTAHLGNCRAVVVCLVGAVAFQSGHGGRATAGNTHWSFQPIRQAAVPDVENAEWPLGPIDRFLLARMEEQGLVPADAADRRTLVRRAHFSLLGLPPSPAEIEAFLTDDAPDAFERLIDRLLASPHYGERWGRHWLDVARFAQSTGGGRSMLYDSAWRYRDYVIRSFNQDKPFDRFIVEQLAGDLLPRDSVAKARDQIIATAFLALGPTNYELQDKEQLRMDVIDEQIDTMGRAFLGMTLGCARCHDHKFDPVPTEEYYALAGIFRSTKTLIHSNVSTWVKTPLPDDRAAEIEQDMAELTATLQTREAELAALRKALGLAADAVALDDEDKSVELVGSWTQSSGVKPFVGQAYRYSNSPEAKARYVFKLDQPGRYEVRISYTPHPNRTPKAEIAIEHRGGKQKPQIDQRQPPGSGAFHPVGSFEFGDEAVITISNAAAKGAVIADAVELAPVPAEHSAELARLQLQVKDLKSQLAAQKENLAKATMTAISVEEEQDPADYHVCVRGSVDELGEIVPRGFLSAATTEGMPEEVPADASGRLELAQWIASDQNPLTARVIANRVWQHLFGTGLVRTADNFGTMGEEPSHPKLLDYLAVRLIESGWRIKPLIREIMLSRTWRLESKAPAAANVADPENRLLSHQNMRRLNAESLYDSILSLSGSLDTKIGGPTVREGTKSEYGYQFDVGRRAIYLPVFRNRLHGLFGVFDFPDPNLSSGRRTVSTLPTQALYLMNSPFVLEQAERAAERLLSEPAEDDRSRISMLYAHGLGRPPSAEELKLAEAFLANAEQADAATRRQQWTQLCQAVIACVDFRYIH